MVNPTSLTVRRQRQAMVPALLLLLAIAAASVLWLQRTTPASAVPENSLRYYEGTANVKVKNGNAYSVYPVNTCTIVEVNHTGQMTDVLVFGVNADAGFIGEAAFHLLCSASTYGGDGALLSEILDHLNEIELELLPGSFIIITPIDEALTGGVGWKTNPVKQTSTQWLFTLKKPEVAAASIALNNNFRMFQANTTLTAKFLRGGEGLYWKIAGMAPLTDAVNPKASVEIETPALGLDSPPQVVYTDPSGLVQTINSYTQFYVGYSEPVNIDPAQVILYCVGAGAQPFTISGQGTSDITISPDNPLPQYRYCTLTIPASAVSDVDATDPPDQATGPVIIGGLVLGGQG